jgi:acyl carrier protein
MKELSMSEPETPGASETVQARIARCVAQVLARPVDQVSPQSRLIEDLGADSLDLVELMYVLEDELAMKLDKQDLSLSAQLGLPESEVHQNEVLTPKALGLLRERYPQAQELLREGVTRARLVSLLTVEALAIGIGKKLAAKEASHAG